MADTQAVGLGFLIMRRWRSRMWGWCCALAVQERSVPRWPTAQLVQGPNVRFIPGPTAHPITAYGIAIGIGNRHDRRAEGPVSCTGFVAGTDGSGLQPSDLSFADQNPGRWSGLGSDAPLVLGLSGSRDQHPDRWRGGNSVVGLRPLAPEDVRHQHRSKMVHPRQKGLCQGKPSQICLDGTRN